MALIYAYAPDEQDCANIGLVGALLARDAEFELRAGEFGELSFTHPIDPWGKWKALQDGAILKTMVPVRLVPEVDNGAYVGKVDVYKVAKSATKYQRYVYYASTAEKDPKVKVQKHQKTKHKKLLKRGTVVTVIADPRPGDDEYRYKVRVGSGKKRVVGYMEKAGLTLTQKAKPVPAAQDGLESDSPSYAIQQQLFRVYEVETEANDRNPGSVTVRARRLVYDLLGNICTYKATANVTCQTACRNLLSRTLYSHPFTVFSDIGDRHVGLDIRDRNPIEALIDPDSGIVAHWGGEVVCDDYDIYLLRRAGIDRGGWVDLPNGRTGSRGLVIRYGKDLEGVSCRLDSSNVATAIRPVGETAAGNPLYLDGHVVNGRHGYNYNSSTKTCANWLPTGFRWALDDDGTRLTSVIERDREWDGYATPKAISLPVADAKVTKTKKDTDPSETSVLTTALARVMLAEAAVAELRAGSDVPEISLDVDFTQLGDTEDYAQYRHLEPLFIYDTVGISHPRAAVSATVNLTRLTWDVAAERVSGAGFGSLGDAVASIPGWQISGISGGKISPGTVNSGQIAADAISTDHLQAGSVNAKVLQAQSVTAEHLAAGAVDAQSISAITAAFRNLTAEDVHAGTLDAGTLAAGLARVASLVAEDISGHSVVADSLSATAAELVTAQVGLLDVDYAHVKDLDADEAIIRDGEADALYIDRLAVNRANLVNAVIGHLVLPGDDGKYYGVRVGADGGIALEEVDVSAAEIAAGETTDGRGIVTDTVTASELNGSTVKAKSAILGTILTHAISAGKITATEGTLASAEIAELRVSSLKALGDSLDLSANQSVTIRVGDAVEEAMNDATPAVLRIDSSRGTVFKDNQVSTVLAVSIHYGAQVIEDLAALRAAFGSTARLQWEWLRLDDEQYGTISASDSRLSDGGFRFTLGPEDVDVKVTFRCALITD